MEKRNYTDISDQKNETKKTKLQSAESESEIDESSIDGIEKLESKTLDSELNSMYLDTVNRNVLDFDFEKICSVTLSNNNVYACLVCGQYYQGKGKKTQAYYHSINDDHKVFINLNSLKVYILPENYEVLNSSFNDIKAIIDPRYTLKQVINLDKYNPMAFDINHNKYKPGFVGLNNIKANDYINVIIQALAHIPMIRDMFLLLPNNDGPNSFLKSNRNNTLQIDSNPGTKKTSKNNPKSMKGVVPPFEECSELIKRLSLLIRKIWHPHAFKSHVSPHEVIQEITNRSNRAFRLDAQGDAFEFLTWFLNTIHFDLNGTKKDDSSIIYKAFRGYISTTTQRSKDAKTRRSKDDPLEMNYENDSETKTGPFLALSLDLPPIPLFRKEEDTVIPQIPLVSLLKKYNGTTTTETKDEVKTFRIKSLPKYIIVHIKRFVKNNFMLEKNTTIVNFPISNVAFGDLLSMDSFYQNENISNADKSSAAAMLPSAIKSSSSQLPGELNIQDGPSLAKVSGTGSLVSSTVAPKDSKSNTPTTTVLPLSGQYLIHTKDRATDQWFCISDLVVEQIMPQMIFLTESCIQIWERQEL
ncbi:hypothetical protein BB559_000450 [Furculomyces boomerangus]|uniref:USP domain-containing protein n=1 Tax=Furculomyces boomerangus TaxID=61424 RepID=A0A2T9Z561_9FUNG|nr:hypothetical protein BB559_000450 [Furculomyces boomerangus]